MRHTGPRDRSATRRLWTVASWLAVGWSLVGLTSAHQTAGAVVTFLVAICGVSSASASETARIKSRFTTIELKTCDAVSPQANAANGRTSEGTGGGTAGRTGGVPTAWVCKGLNGYPVHISHHNQQQFLSFGRSAQTRRAAAQPLGAVGVPGSLFSTAQSRATIEWRFRRHDGRDAPYATIVRVYSTNTGVSTGASTGASNQAPARPSMASNRDLLIVTKVTPTEACQIARIDVRTTSDAIILARSVADDLGATFDCSKDQPRIIGNRQLP
jgi:hypothetical protein